MPTTALGQYKAEERGFSGKEEKQGLVNRASLIKLVQ